VTGSGRDDLRDALEVPRIQSVPVTIKVRSGKDLFDAPEATGSKEARFDLSVHFGSVRVRLTPSSPAGEPNRSGGAAAANSLDRPSGAAFVRRPGADLDELCVSDEQSAMVTDVVEGSGCDAP
jgi:hypothetical protein